MRDTTNILLVGVGGQGIILASDLLSNLALTLGLDVKKSEIHGMSQRGGSVESHVRLGEEVLSPLIPRGRAQYLIAMEESEALRYRDYLSPDAVVLCSTFRVIPASVTTGGQKYPDHEEIERALRRHCSSVAMLDIPGAMVRVGNARTANVILLGCLSRLLPYPLEAWLEMLNTSLPAKILEVNLRAFEEGRQLAGIHLGE